MPALHIAEGYLGPDHTIVAGVHRKAGKYGPAEKLYLRAIAIRERSAGRNSPRLIRILRGYAALLRATERDGEAKTRPVLLLSGTDRRRTPPDGQFGNHHDGAAGDAAELEGQPKRESFRRQHGAKPRHHEDRAHRP